MRSIFPDDSLSRKPFLPGDSSIRQVGSHCRFWFCAVAGLMLDLWSKQWAFSNIASHENRRMVPGVVSFIKSFNEGALFGLGQGFRWVFVAASVLAFGFVLYLFSQSSGRRWSLHLALGMILGGATGNLYDRAVFGHVRDFVKFEPRVPGFEVMSVRVPSFDVWPWVFNFADVLLVIGVGVLLVNFWLDKRAREDAAAERQSAAGTEAQRVE